MTVVKTEKKEEFNEHRLKKSRYYFFSFSMEERYFLGAVECLYSTRIDAAFARNIERTTFSIQSLDLLIKEME